MLAKQSTLTLHRPLRLIQAPHQVGVAGRPTNNKAPLVRRRRRRLRTRGGTNPLRSTRRTAEELQEDTSTSISNTPRLLPPMLVGDLEAVTMDPMHLHSRPSLRRILAGGERTLQQDETRSRGGGEAEEEEGNIVLVLYAESIP